MTNETCVNLSRRIRHDIVAAQTSFNETEHDERKEDLREDGKERKVI
jgi:hypothetical protein